MDSLIAYIPMDRRQALVSGQTLPDRTNGAALFADISGFTPLTEALVHALGPQRGPEELTIWLNHVYGALIADVHHYRGSVIGFSGDAITCWFDGDNGERAVTCALAMQQTVKQFSGIQIAEGSTVSLEIKVALATGPIRRFVVGDPAIQLIDAVAGKTLDLTAQGENVANRGDVIVAAETVATLGDRLTIVGQRTNNTTQESFAVVSAVTPQSAGDPWPVPSSDQYDREQVRAWVLPTVYRWLSKGQSAFLAELRPAAALFLRFAGIDYDEDDDAGLKLDAFIRWVQQVIARYEGALVQLTFGDKGSYIQASFGALMAHDDNASRAIACALTLRKLPPELDYIRDVQIGVAHGQMRVGGYGSDTRRTYGVLGEKTNLAARLMSGAKSGEIRTEFETYSLTKSRWHYTTFPSVRVKGVAGLVRVYEPTDPVTRPQPGMDVRQARLVGRKTELARLLSALEDAMAGKSRVCLLNGEAGIGKSRLVSEVITNMRQHGISGLVGSGQSIERQTPYRVWRDILTSYFDLDDYGGVAERRVKVRELVREVASDQLERLPLLNDILNLGFADTETTSLLDPEQRRQSLGLLVLALLRAWARERTLVLILEDIHWLDSLSSELLVEVTRAMIASQESLFVLLTSRPRPIEDSSPQAAHLSTLEQIDGTETIPLLHLEPDEIVALVTARLGLPEGGLIAPVAALVQQRSGGNPFFAEEVVFALRDRGVITIDPVSAEDPTLQCALRDDFVQASQTLPNTLQGLILARIDRLSPERQLALKVAAVIGRMFAYAPLHHTLTQYAPVVAQALNNQLQALAQQEFTTLEAPEPDLTYVFRQIVTQEVAYQTLLYAQRRQLHLAVAEWYETTFGSPISAEDTPGSDVQGSPLAPFFPLLVHHFHHAEEPDKERFYAQKAGEQAAKQFANAEAIRYFSRAIELTSAEQAEQLFTLHLSRERVFNLQGMRAEQHADLQALESFANQLDDNQRRAEIALVNAEYGLETGDYPSAAAAAQTAIDLVHGSAAGTEIEAKGYFHWGHSLYHQGDYESATAKLMHSLSIAGRVDLKRIEADSLLNLGLLSWAQSDLNEAQAYFESALSIFRDINGQTGQSMALNNLGIVSAMTGEFASALNYFEQALHISQRVGARRSEGMAYTNLGNIAAMTGDYSQAVNYLEGVLTISREIGDRKGEAISMGNLGVIYDKQGSYEAAGSYFEGALHLYREIGDRRNEGMTLSNASLYLHHIEDNETAHEYSTRALAIARDLGDRHLEGDALTYQAHALVALERPTEALAIYEQAVGLRDELGDETLALESRAGLARAALRMQQTKQACDQVEVIMAFLDQNPLENVEETFRVYETCVTVLQASDDERATGLLRTTHDLLQNAAAKISDLTMRRSFLDNVLTHRNLIDSYQSHGTHASQD